MFGSHLSIAGGMYRAVDEAVRLSFETVQVFTKNQQQWRVPAMSEEAVALWLGACAKASFEATVSHDSYLINLAATDETVRAKSLALFEEEVRRCETLKIPLLVSHPGAHLCERDSADAEQAACHRVAQAIDETFAKFPRAKTTLCLEVTAGQGTCLGHRLEHLASIIKASKFSRRLGVCLDTAHLFAAGYDFRGRKYNAFLKQVDQTVGLERVKAWHLNDSRKPLGSRVDRHEHIGHGTIGVDGFRPIVRDKRWRDVPKILETAKEKDALGRDWDSVNLQALRALM